MAKSKSEGRKAGTSSHQEGKGSVEASRPQKPEQGQPAKGQGSPSDRKSDEKKKHRGKNAETTDNDHQKTVQGKNQKGPKDKAGKSAGGNEGSKGQNADGPRSRTSVGSHKPGGDGPGTKKFKHESDSNKR